jgi:hypothetical protein
MAICYRNFKNIVINGDSFLKGIFPSAVQRQQRDQYEASIVEQLDTIWKTWTGWAVVREAIDSGKTVTIVPYSKADEQRMGEGNAFARPAWWIRMMDATPAGAPIFMGGSDDPSTPNDERYRTVPLFRGTGRGADVDIHYSPEDHAPRCLGGGVAQGACRMGGDDETADAVLVHELVHAIRMMYGRLLRVPTFDQLYDNDEEFFAVLVANIYMSEKGKTRLRANHHGKSILSEGLDTSEKFLGNNAGLPPMQIQLENRRLVHKFICTNHNLCAHISGKSAAKFNPIGVFMRYSQEYPLFPR